MILSYKTTAALFLMLAAFLPAAQSQSSPSSPPEDASAAFANAVQAATPLPTDQSVIEGFTNPAQAPPVDLFNATGAPSSNLGLAPQFNQTGPGSLSRLRYQGLGTVAYAQDPIPTSGAVNLGCGFGYIDRNFTASYVGVGASFFQRGFGCGRCIKLQCDDATCETPGKQAIAQIVDQCGECFDADINMAYPLFNNLTNRPPSPNPTIAVSWEFIDCSPYINGTIKMLVKPGGSAYYQAFNFANARQPITAVQVNGQLLTHETNNFWSWSPTGGPINPRGPFDFALLGANRQVLRVRLPQLRNADLGVQFDASPAGAPVNERVQSATGG